LTLLHNRIEISDAESGHVQKLPEVPGVMPRTDLGAQPKPPAGGSAGPGQ
jgi:hypothetical protein